MKKIVYFNPKLSLVPQGGGCVHSHEILNELGRMGYELNLFLAQSPWNFSIHGKTWNANRVVVLDEKDDRDKIKESLSSFIEEVSPDLIFMNYPSWDNVLDHEKFSAIPKVMYNHHFESIRQKLGNYYITRWNEVAPKSLEEVHPDLYDPDFLNKPGFEPDPGEYKAYDRYDLTIAISDFGAELIQKNCKKTRVVSMPVCLSPIESISSFERLALYPISPYSFNYQGYYYFANKILPCILKKAPLFRARLTGFGSETFFGAPNVFCSSYVLDLSAEYKKASFLLCPAFSGTGQQVKIIESMHYGVPVVMMKNPMQYNPVEHGETGFVANSAEEFSEYALRLYYDRELARKMGMRAQEQARSLYSNNTLREKLSSINSLFD